MLSAVGRAGINARQLNAAWRYMDKDGDGRMELAEFDEWLFGEQEGDGHWDGGKNTAACQRAPSDWAVLLLTPTALCCRAD